MQKTRILQGVRSSATVAAALVAISAATSGCGDSGGNESASTEASGPAKTAAAPGAADPCAGTEPGEGPIAWFHDDYAAARACARSEGRPLVIDMWAPWCHTCLSMKHNVLADRSLEPLADRFVWLAVDTDKDENAAVVSTFEPEVWPTFFVISPKTETVQARYLGAASIDQFREFLRQGEQGHLDSRATRGGLDEGSPLFHVRAGDRAAVADAPAEAEAAYRAALEAAPADWPRRPDVLVSLIGALYDQRDWGGCAALGRDHMDDTGQSASAADFAYVASLCASKVDHDDGVALLERAEARLERLVGDEDAPLSVDDRSDAMRILREVKLALEENDEARAVARRQRELLDRAAAEADTPFQAMTHHWPRAEVYAFLGVPGELVDDLKASVADLPEEYDPPYRLAWIYAQMGEHEKALDMAERALGLVYGPRKARVQSLVVDIHEARGDTDAQIEAQADLVAIYESLPEGQSRPDALEAARNELAELRDESN